MDPRHDFGGGMVCTTYAQLRDYWARVYSLESFSIILRPASETELDDMLNGIAPPFDGRPGPVTNTLVTIDEADMVSTPGKDHPALRRMVHYGRHQGLDLIVTARRARNLSTDIRSEADALVVFRCEEPRDVAYARERCGAELAEAVRVLPDRQYLVHSQDAGAPRLLGQAA